MKTTRGFLLAREDAARVHELLPAARIRRPMSMRRVAALLLLTTLILVALWLGIARAAEAVGTWKGVLGPNDIVVTLVIKKARSDATLRFGTPRNCSLSARFEIRAGATSRYGLRNSNGGACDRLEGGTLALVDGEAGRLTLVLIDVPAKKREEIEMAVVK